MNHFHEQACESVDAAVFTGDILYSDLEAFKEYLGRWNRAVAEHEKAEADDLKGCLNPIHEGDEVTYEGFGTCTVEVTPDGEEENPEADSMDVFQVRDSFGHLQEAYRYELK